MLLYYLFWMFMSFVKHFYIIFGTNLLTQSPVPVSVFSLVPVFRRKGISNGVPTEWNLRERDFWNERDPGDLELKSRKLRGGHEAGRHAYPPGHGPHPRGPLVALLTDFLRPYILIYSEYIQEHHETLFPPPQLSIPVSSHLGAFFSAPPEGASITEGLYINSMAPPMMCE